MNISKKKKKKKKGDFETGTKNRHFRYAFTGMHN
jgi:hypothetical protein